MMNSLVGAALGGLVAGAVALMASGQAREAPADAWNPSASAVQAAMMNETGVAATAPTLVQCQPDQEAVLRRGTIGGQEVAEISCVSRADARFVSYDEQPAYGGSDIVTRTAVRTPAQPQVRERVVYTEAREPADKRSWGKTALIIGGSSGAGAGVGAIVGGKKGALIGAAIGGGAASIYESTKR